MNHKTKSLALLGVSACVSMHCMNRIFNTISCVKNILNCNDNNYYEWRFGKVRYQKKGNGHPILLLHDLIPGSSLYEYHKIINDLSKNFEVYSIDLLGYGLSDKPNITYTNYLYVQLIIDFIKNVIGKRTDLIASGDSCPIAVMACHNDPEVLNQMVFINPQSIQKLNTIPNKNTKLLKMLIDLPVIGTFIYNILTHRTMIEKEFRENYFYNTFRIQENDISAYLESSHTLGLNAKYTFASYVGRYMNANIIHALKEINHNIFLIGGAEKKENESILDHYVYYNNAIEKVIIPETKSLPQLEQPDKILDYLNLYLVR